MKRKAEAYELIKTALFKNMANFTCWHVYGILNRANKKFDDARKAYINALKSDETNQNVLRDLSLLQIQLKDYEGHAETRRKMVVTKAQNLQNWTTYLVAVFMTKDYKVCCEIWDSIMQILGDDPLSHLKLHELNELFLFRVKIFEAMGEYK